jgi:hypothetical protein
METLLHDDRDVVRIGFGVGGGGGDTENKAGDGAGAVRAVVHGGGGTAATSGGGLAPVVAATSKGRVRVQVAWKWHRRGSSDYRIFQGSGGPTRGGGMAVRLGGGGIVGAAGGWQTLGGAEGVSQWTTMSGRWTGGAKDGCGITREVEDGRS